MLKYIISLFLCFLLLPSSAFAEVRPDHPRIFINSDPAYYNCLDSLRARVEKKPWLAHYERLRMWRNSLEDVPRGRKTANVIPSYAIRWVIDPLDTEAADTALAMLLSLREDDEQSWNLSMAAVVYDWLYHYPGFKEKDKKLVRERMKTWMLNLTARIKGDDDVFNNHSWYHLRAVYLASLALTGEVPEAGEWLVFAESYWKKNLEGAIALFQGGWHEGLSYSTRASVLNLAMWLEAMESASSPRIHAFEELKKDGDWLNRFTLFYASQVLPDGTLARYNDIAEFMVDGGWDNCRLFMIVAREYTNGLAAWILSRALERDLDLLPLHIWYYLLWYDPGIPVTRPEEVLPKSVRLCPDTYDMFFMRSGWDKNATLVSFHAGDWFGAHDHLDTGHFTIFRKKFLALDAGVYAPMNSAHHINFYHRTLAHNTLLIYDPAERFQVPAPEGMQVLNEGGQRVIVSLGGHSTQENRSADVWQANRLQGFHFERATVLDWFSSDTLDFIRADLTKAYNSDFFCAYGKGFTNRPKVKSVVRSLAYLKPSTVIVYDQVTVTDSSFRKTWLLNTALQPYLDNSDTFLAQNGPARLAGRTFLPRETGREIWGSNSQPFRLAGMDLYHYLDLSLYPEVVPGGWILRISPARPALKDEFLNVLVAGDAGETTAELLSGWRMLEADGARVLARGETVLAFPSSAGVEISIMLPGDTRERQVYILGVPSDKEYLVEWECCRVLYEGLKARNGVLFFHAPEFGEIRVTGE